MLLPLVDLDGAEVVDLYAGSGSFGLECLSRGAGRVTFVEQARPALAALRHNIDTLGFADRSRVLVGPVAVHGPALGAVDLAFCDPPYADDPWSGLFEMLRADVVVGHAERSIPLPVGWIELRRREYGRAKILIAEPDVVTLAPDANQTEAPDPEVPGR